MSLSDEFFKEEDQSKTPLAKWLVLTIVFLFLVWLIWAIFFGGLFKKKEEKGWPTTIEEKKEVLDNLSLGTSSPPISVSEKKKVLENLSKKSVKTPVMSDEEKFKALQGLQ